MDDATREHGGDERRCDITDSHDRSRGVDLVARLERYVPEKTHADAEWGVSLGLRGRSF